MKAKIIRKEQFKYEEQYNRLKAENEKLQADLDYIMMMTDIEIPQEIQNNGLEGSENELV